MKNILIATNTLLRDPKTLLRKSVESVAWIKEVDFENLSAEYFLIRQFARWIRENEQDAQVEALYVFDEQVLDLIMVGEKFPELMKVREIVQEKAVENGERFLNEVKKLCAQEGIFISIKIRTGSPAHEVQKEAKEFGASLLLVGDNSLAQELKRSIPAAVLPFHKPSASFAQKLKARLSLETAPEPD